MAAQEEVTLKIAIGIDSKVEIDSRSDQQRHSYVESHIWQFLQKMCSDNE